MGMAAGRDVVISRGDETAFKEWLAAELSKLSEHGQQPQQPAAQEQPVQEPSVGQSGIDSDAVPTRSGTNQLPKQRHEVQPQEESQQQQQPPEQVWRARLLLTGLLAVHRPREGLRLAQTVSPH